MDLGSLSIPFYVEGQGPISFAFPVGNQLQQHVEIPGEDPSRNPYRGWNHVRSVRAFDVPDDDDRRFTTLAMFCAVRQNAFQASIPDPGVRRMVQILGTDLTLRSGGAVNLDNTPYFWAAPGHPINYGPPRGIFHMTHGRLDFLATASRPDVEDLVALVKDDQLAPAGSGRGWCPDPLPPGGGHLLGLFTCHLVLMPRCLQSRAVFYPTVSREDERFADHRVDPLPCLEVLLRSRGMAPDPRFPSTRLVTNATFVNGSQERILGIVEAGTLAELEAADPVDLPPGPFALLPYQQCHVDWMDRVEVLGVDREWIDLTVLHPEGLWYSPVTKQFRTSRPRPLRGGMLLYDMGLGKTCTVLGLCLRRPRHLRQRHGGVVPDDRGLVEILPLADTNMHFDGTRPVPRAHRVPMSVGGTLVVVPVSLIFQWRDEIQAKAPTLSVGMYYGTRDRVRGRLDEYDVVLTTYTVLAAENKTFPSRGLQQWFQRVYGNQRYRPPVADVFWSRVVFDESHQVTLGSSVGNACEALASWARWTLTGTPCPGPVESLVTQTTLLRDPLVASPLGRNMWSTWRYVFRSDETVRRALGPIARRVTASSRVRGELLVDIPDPETRDVYVDPTPENLETYRSLARRLVTRIEEAPSGIVATQALRDLRCFLGGVTDGSLAPNQPRDRFRVMPRGDPPDDLEECPVCYEVPAVPVRAPCGHIFCVPCMTHWFGARAATTCPFCRRTMHERNMQILAPPPEAPRVEGGDDRVYDKERRLADLLRGLDDEKMIIFVQEQATATRLGAVCDEVGIPFFTITGSMTGPARGRAIADFRTRPGPLAFLLTVRTSACGINLTCATRILLYEPATNPALEAQAISRCVRLGQRHRVRVDRLITRGTVEEELVRIREGGARLTRERILDAIRAHL